MTFWGVEVKPGKPFTLVSEDLNGSLILTQATLGTGSSSKKSTLQVRVGEKKPIYVCTLLPEISECFTLNLEFEEEDDVEFSVVGPTSIHLSGYVQRPEHDDEDCELDCCGEDIAETDSEDIESEDEEDYEDDFINDEDMPTHSSSPAKKTGVVIEEIEDDDKPVSAKGGSKKEKKEKKKKKKLLVPQQENVVDGKTDALELESEDEDGFPLSASGNGESRFAKLQASTKTKIAEETKKNDDDVKDGKSAGNLKRNADAMDQDEEPKCDAIAGDASADKKKKKKNKKAKTDKNETEGNVKQNAVDVANVKPVGEKEDKKISQAVKETKQSKDKPSKTRTYSNGLVVEKLEMGKPDGKRASAGKKISVSYVGKLKQNGETFDASKTPFKFRLGIGQVIKGWDVGVEGMRVGDKRRLTVPPAMGYGENGAPPTIPPNAWLVFDVELVNVA